MTQPTSGPDADFALTETQNWAARSHDELYEAVHAANDPGRVGQLADEWKQLGLELSESAERMSERLRSTEAGWQGEAADAARSAIQQLADWNNDAGTTAGALAERISVQGQIMETAKAEMPEPVKGAEVLHVLAAATYASGNLEGFVRATQDLRANQEAASSAHERAVQVMTWMEDQSRGVDGSTPKFTPPPNPVEEEAKQLQHRVAPMAASEPAQPFSQGRPLEGTAPGMPGETVPAGAPGGGGGVAATQRMSVPPLAAQGAGPEMPGVPNAPTPSNFQGPGGVGGMDQPTTSFQNPNLGGGGAFDGPTKSMPVPKLGPGPSTPQNVPSLDDFRPGSTTPQSTTPQSSPGGFHNPNLPLPNSGEDRLHQPRTFQGPDGIFPGGQRPNQIGNRPGPRDQQGGWRGQIPPVPGPGGPGGTGFTGGPGGGGAGGFRGGPGAVPGLGSGGASGLGGGGAGGSSSLAPGGSSGVGQGGSAGVGRGPDGGVGGRGTPGAAGMAGAPGMGAGPMGQRGQGQEDKERSARYVEGGPIVEVPGADLPPPVIGEGKRKKRQDQG